MRSPFKFLDSYTISDHDIFFGREQETEEIYSRLFYSKLLLIYGPSGSGKTSLLQCGVSNRFGETNWKPIFIRRKQEINQSLIKELKRQAITKLKVDDKVSNMIYSLYLDYLTPVYLIFDQFEELFIFGSEQEKKEFIATLNSLLETDQGNTHVVLSIREEYLAALSELEDEIPQLFENRIRVEKMKKTQAQQVIESPCEVCEVGIEAGVSEAVIEKLSSESGSLELTWVQVLMDRLYNMAVDEKKEDIIITLSHLDSLGKIGDVLGSFLEDQLKVMPNGEQGEVVLKTMVTTEGTKRQLTLEEIEGACRSLGHQIDQETIKSNVQYFIDVRILSDKDENNRFELKHDSLAAKIYERLTLVEKDLMEVRQFVEYAYQNYQSRRKYLGEDDLNYIQPYERKLFLSNDLVEFIKRSRIELIKLRRRKRNVLFVSGTTLVLVLSILTIWALNTRNEVIQKSRVILQQKDSLTEAKNATIETINRLYESLEKTRIAENEARDAMILAQNELYSNIANSISISSKNMNVLYRGVDNEIAIVASGIDPDKLFPKCFEKGNVQNQISCIRSKNEFIIRNIPFEVKEVQINTLGITTSLDTVNFKPQFFRVKILPDPYVILKGLGIKGGEIKRGQIDKIQGVGLRLHADFYIDMSIEQYSFSVLKKGDQRRILGYHKSINFTKSILQAINDLEDGEQFWIDDVLVRLKDSGRSFYLRQSLIFTIRGVKVVKANSKKNYLVNAGYSYLEKEPKTAIRLAEKAYLLDPSDENAHSLLISAFANSTSITDEIKDSIDQCWISPDGGFLLAVSTVGSDNSLNGRMLSCYKINDFSLEKKWDIDSFGAWSLVLSRGDSSFILLKEDNIATHYNFDGSINSEIKFNSKIQQIFDLQKDGSIIYKSSMGTFENRNSLGQITSFKSGSFHISDVVFVGLNYTYFSIHDDGLYIWTANGDLIKNHQRYKGLEAKLSISNDESKILKWDKKSIYLFDTTGNAYDKFENDFVNINCVNFSHDGHNIITTEPNRIGIWKLHGNNKLLQEIDLSNDGEIGRSIAFSDENLSRIFYYKNSTAKIIPLEPENILNYINSKENNHKFPPLSYEIQEEMGLHD